MPKLRAFIVTGAVFLVALAPASALAKAGGTDRPFKSTDVGAIGTLNIPTGEFSSQATEIISHVGKATTINQGTVVFTGPSTFTITAEFIVLAPNGDQLTGTFTGTGTFTATGSDATVVSTITGGSGRFADASGATAGSIHSTTISSDGVTLIFHAVSRLSGHISY
jgi:hypothetical protein